MQKRHGIVNIHAEHSKKKYQEHANVQSIALCSFISVIVTKPMTYNVYDQRI